MSRTRFALAFAGLALLSWLVAACFCGDACDEPIALRSGSYRLTGDASVETTSLVFDADAGTVVVTREAAGRRTVERWRVGDAGQDSLSDPTYDYDAGRRDAR